jgi:hypothetical protein
VREINMEHYEGNETQRTLARLLFSNSIVAVVRKHKWVGNFFDMILVLLNVVNGSSKRKDIIRDKYKEQVREALGSAQLQSGT